MNTCKWIDDNPIEVFECEVCERTVHRSKVRILPYYRTCRVQSSQGFGDWFANLFKRVGIKQKPGCGCSKRQDALNKTLPFTKQGWKDKFTNLKIYLISLTYPFIYLKAQYDRIRRYTNSTRIGQFLSRKSDSDAR